MYSYSCIIWYNKKVTKWPQSLIVVSLIMFFCLCLPHVQIKKVPHIRATVSVFFVPCCPVLLSFYLVLSYMFELNKWNGMVLRTSLTWWRNVDIIEIMPFTDDNKHVIKISHKEKRYSYHKFICEFSDKNWNLRGLDHLIKKIDECDSIIAQKDCELHITKTTSFECICSCEGGT